MHSLYPADFKLPMVAPADIAHVAARLLTEPLAQTGRHYVEGPAHYAAHTGHHLPARLLAITS